MQTVKSRAELQPAAKREEKPDPMVAITHALEVLAQQSANAMHAVTALAAGQQATHVELGLLAQARKPPTRLECVIVRDKDTKLMTKVIVTPVQ